MSETPSSGSDRSQEEDVPAPHELIQPGRSITGISATLLPFTEDGSVDWAAFDAHLARTEKADLTPAVNMDTGYVNLLDPPTRRQVLEHAERVLDESFVAGAFPNDTPGDPFGLDAYRRQIDQIQAHGGIPIVFQSYGLTEREPSGIVEAYRKLGRDCPRFIAFELGTMFAPFGKIYDLSTFSGLMDISACIGAKHSSLDRELEWKRLALRNDQRPDFKIFTGNDLAIDMVKYGSDYLLGLSTFAPDAFAVRDRLWAEEDPSFYALNDLLQYLGFFAFREPVPAYKHSAAQFLVLRDWLEDDTPHPKGEHRPESDRSVLRDIANRLEAWTS